jgi:hypothetical protein
MQDGTVVPIQVDAQGRLVAEGLQGVQGPAGPAGPAGPPGPDSSNWNKNGADINYTAGRVLVGTSTAGSTYRIGTTSFTPKVQAEGTGVSPLAIQRTDGPPHLFIATGVNVASGSDIGKISFNAKDGTNLVQAATIGAECDGTPGANDMPGRLVFSTTADGASSPTERMRISRGGSAGFFCDTSSDVMNLASSRTAGGLRWFIYATYGASAINTGTQSFGVYTSGDVVNTNNSYGSLSDIKLKENIVDANSQWNDLKALQVRNYNFKEGQTHTQIGLIAQEVELVSPGLVSESPDRDAEGNDLGTVTKRVNYSVLYMKAVKALQEAMERIEVLEQRLADAGIA